MNWISDLKTEFKNISSNKKDLRQFGFVISGILFTVEIYFLLIGKSFNPILILLGSIILLLALLSPKILLPFQKVWMILAVLLGFIMTRLILSLLFYLVITPIGLIAKIFGKSFLDLNFHDSKNSYWYIREKKKYEKLDTERQF